MADYEPQLVVDSRLIGVEKMTVPLKSGPAQNNFHRQTATSATTSSVSFNYQVPNQSILIDRHVMIENEMTFTIPLRTTTAGATPTADVYDRWAWGSFFGPQAFPFNSLITDATLTLNNNSISISQQDIMFGLIKTLPLEFFQRYQSTCPSYPDVYADVADAARSLNNPGGHFQASGFNQDLLPRGSFELVSVSSNDASVIDASGAGTKDITYTVVIKTIEPIFISPLLVSGGGSNSRAMYGLNNFGLNLSLDSTASRALFLGAFQRSFNRYVVKNDVLLPDNVNTTLAPGGVVGFAIDQTKSFLHFNLLSPQPNQLLPSRCILPYKGYDRFITAGAVLPQKAAVGLPVYESVTLNVVSTNKMPSRIFVYGRKRRGELSIQDLNWAVSIGGVSVQVNNSATLLSTARPHQLYLMSKKNGYQGSWAEWSGIATVESKATAVQNPVGGVLLKSLYEAPMSGSVLVISPTRDLSLPAYMTSGSLGQITFQINLSVTNQTQDPANIDYFVFLESDGVFSIQAGASSLVDGLYDMAQVEAITSGQSPIPSDMIDPVMTGGGKDESLASVMEQKLKMKGPPSSGSGVSSGGASRSGGAKSSLDSLVF